MTKFLYNNSQFLAKDTVYHIQNPRLCKDLTRVLSFSSDGTAFARPNHVRLIDKNELRLYKKLCSLICGRQVVVACVGTDLVGGDCLGPLVGQLLVEADAPAYVYGTLQQPVTALNVQQTRDFICSNHPGRCVIAVDCAVGAKSEEGLITVSGNPLRPGLAMGKQLGFIGDVSVTAITSSHAPDKKEFSLVRLGFIYSLARRVAGLILNCLCDTLYNTNVDYAIKNTNTAH